MGKPKILILDYSLDQFETPLIESAIPDGIEILSIHVRIGEDIPEGILRQSFTHVIHSGSSLSINEEAPFTQRVIRLIRAAVGREIWQMGICYGHQLLNKVLVGDHAIRAVPRGFEVGWKRVWFLDAARQLFDVKGDELLWQHHFDEVVEIPMWSELLATNGHTHIQAFVNFDLKLLGTQFHPEFDEAKGNAFFRKDQSLLEEHGFNLDEILAEKPTMDSRKTFFEYFLSQN
jgi:GMP synthase-like glutamine amidotransferase